MKEILSDNMFTISLEKYRVMAKHGAYEFEHLEEQPFIVSISVQITELNVNDDVDPTVDQVILSPSGSLNTSQLPQ